MKKIILLFLVTLCYSQHLFAEDFSKDGIAYKKISSSAVEVSSSYHGIYTAGAELVIPSEVSHNGVRYDVTGIGELAFANTYIKSIHIPQSIQRIGLHAFVNTTRLTDITSDENNTQFSSADGVLFNKDKSTLLAYPAGRTDDRYDIPASVKTIGEDAFSNAANLKYVNIFYVEDIEKCGFYISGLTHVTFGPYLKSVSDYAFSSCKSLASLSVDRSDDIAPLQISQYAFDGTNSIEEIIIERDITEPAPANRSWLGSQPALTSLILGGTLTSVPEGLFMDCYNLNEVRIYATRPMTIGKDAFKNCTDISTVRGATINSWLNISFANEYSNPLVYAGHFHMASEVDTLTIPDGVATIPTYSFIGNRFKEIILPESVTELGDKSFYSENNQTESITLRAKTPPEAPADVFSENQYSQTTLWLPAGAEEAYASDTLCWAKFKSRETEYRVTGVSLNYSEASMEIGQEIQMTATIFPENAKNKRVIWNSGNPDIADIDETGVITARSEGETEISAVSVDNPDISATCHITVVSATVALAIKHAGNGEISISYPKHHAPTIAVTPAVGWAISCVTLDGEPVETIGDSLYRLPSLEQNAELRVSFTEISTSTTGNHITGSPKVIPAQDSITIIGATPGDEIAIHTPDGITVYHNTIHTTEERIALSKGLYIISISDKTYKVAL